MPDAIEAKVQRLAVGTRVELYDVDLSPLGSATVLRYTPASQEDALLGVLTWQGEEYSPLPISMEGLSISGKGSLPRPTLSMSNIFGEYNTLEDTYGRLEGAIVTRWSTFAEYLDDGDTPDPTAHLPVDQFYIDRLAERDDVIAKLELRTVIDVGDKKIPARQVLRNACTHVYRTHVSGTTFDYTQATCPYVGTDYFDANDAVVGASLDKCSKRLSGCRLRFVDAPLPTRAFPAVGKYR